MRYYPFMVNLDRGNGSCDNLNNPSSRTCVANKTEYFRLNVLDMIRRINESKTLTKHISCKYECNYRKCNSN